MTGKEIIEARYKAKIDAAGRSAHQLSSRDKTRLECWQRAIEELLAEMIDDLAERAGKL